MSVGRKAMHFEGTGFGDVVKVEMDLDRTKEDSVRGNLSMAFGFGPWRGVDVRHTPYVEKVYHLLRGLVNRSGTLWVHLEVEGAHVLDGKDIEIGDPEQLGDLLNFAAYVKRARTVARATGSLVPIDLEAEFSAADHAALADAADTFDGKKRYDCTDLATMPTFTMIATDGGEDVRAITEGSEFREVQLRFPAREIVVFGREIALPPVEVNLHDVRLHINGSRTSDSGMEFDIETESGPNFSCEYRCVQAAPGSAQ
jgi:hypothetical protein